jgi:hypothetical protein
MAHRLLQGDCTIYVDLWFLDAVPSLVVAHDGTQTSSAKAISHNDEESRVEFRSG